MFIFQPYPPLDNALTFKLFFLRVYVYKSTFILEVRGEMVRMEEIVKEEGEEMFEMMIVMICR